MEQLIILADQHLTTEELELISKVQDILKNPSLPVHLGEGILKAFSTTFIVAHAQPPPKDQHGGIL